jgi:DNA-binding transcriptional ArsR family regulator
VRYVDSDEGRCAAAAALGAEVEHRQGPWPRRYDRAPITVEASGELDGLTATLRSTDDYGFCTAVAIHFAPTVPLPLLEMYTKVRGSLDIGCAARLASTLKAFSDPTRLLIVQALAERELCGCDLGWITGRSDMVVSHHLGRLRRDGLVSSRREGKVVFASLTESGRVLLERVEAVMV